jgi:hypothetical protein
LTDLHSGNMQFVDGDRRHENSSPIVIAGWAFLVVDIAGRVTVSLSRSPGTTSRHAPDARSSHFRTCSSRLTRSRPHWNDCYAWVRPLGPWSPRITLLSPKWDGERANPRKHKQKSKVLALQKQMPGRLDAAECDKRRGRAEEEINFGILRLCPGRIRWVILLLLCRHGWSMFRRPCLL